MKKNFYFDKKTGTSTCEIDCGDIRVKGTAHCGDSDLDMLSERTGLFIAETRANIKYLKAIKKNQIKPQMKILKHLEDSMKQSQKYNTKSYEAKMIRSQLRALNNQLTTVEQEIIYEEQYLNEYIKQKEKIYKRIRNKAKAENQ